MNEVKQVIKDKLIPIIRERGFKGSFPHFRRKMVANTQLLMFQFDKWGTGEFVIEIALAPLGNYSPWNGLIINENKLTVPYFMPRYRLGSKSIGSDNWYKFPKDITRACDDLNKLDDKFLILSDHKSAQQGDAPEPASPAR